MDLTGVEVLFSVTLRKMFVFDSESQCFSMFYHYKNVRFKLIRLIGKKRRATLFNSANTIAVTARQEFQPSLVVKHELSMVYFEDVLRI